MSKLFVPLIPPHKRYFEMFAGGLSMFFRKPKASWNVVNDKDNNIVNLYTCVIKNLDELVNYLNWLPKSRKLFLDFRAEIKECNEFNIPDPLQAAKYFYCIRHSFNKLIHTPFSKNKDMNKKWKDELTYSRERIGGSTIENLDFAELVKKYPPATDDFWYLDPPYFIATDKGDYYMNNFNSEDHYRFKETVDSINEGGAKFMISYDYKEEVKDMYSNYNIKTIELRNYAGTTDEARLKKRKEYLILNYEPTSQLGIF
tara:strand:+ start:315 stop:1085 length:771 start_codon:yes stop_codon:yes gene_type:complete